MPTVRNPILKGFNPDPSICCVGSDFYIATSTFEYFPGVQIHHSKDLLNWELIAHPLNRKSQLNMEGNPSSGGIWAPCLTYSDNQFWLIYTDVKKWKGRKASSMHDQHNYLVTTKNITDDWSEPIYLNSAGFDPSLFHDDDGKKWYVQMEWDYRALPKGAGNERTVERKEFSKHFNGIWLQEYDPLQQKLIGTRKQIFGQTPIGFTEGPHIYKCNGYYYLMTAEGGTSYDHAVTIARSKNIDGPYEVHPENPILTSSNNPNLKLQKAGHASMCQANDGNWYLAHLCGRPLTQRGRCVLGRETALQPLEWKNNWPYLKSNLNHPLEQFNVPEINIPVKPENPNLYCDFTSEKLNIHLQTLRIPQDPSWINLTENPSHLRLYGQESPTSNFRQSIVAKRQQHFQFESECSLKFSPYNYNQLAGLMYRYNEENFYYLHVSHNEKIGKHLSIITTVDDIIALPLYNDEIPLHDNQEILLRIKVIDNKVNFSYSLDKTTWLEIGETLPSDIMSDEFAYPMGFTGAFVALACSDTCERKIYADFDYFSYRVL